MAAKVDWLRIRNEITSLSPYTCILTGLAADAGPCPTEACSSEHDVCRVSLSGEYYCDCVKDCRRADSSDLWALVVIPCVIVVVLIVLLVLLYRRRYTTTSKVSPRGRRDDIHPPPSPMAARSRSRGGSTSVRGRVRSPHISGGRWWLSCRQPACL